MNLFSDFCFFELLPFAGLNGTFLHNRLREVFLKLQRHAGKWSTSREGRSGDAIWIWRSARMCGDKGECPVWAGVGGWVRGAFARSMSLGKLSGIHRDRNLEHFNKGQKLVRIEHELSFLKLFGHAWDIPINSRGVPPKSLCSLGLKGHTELFGPPPFSHGRPPPTPPGDIRTQKFEFVLLFLPDLS